MEPDVRVIEMLPDASNGLAKIATAAATAATTAKRHKRPLPCRPAGAIERMSFTAAVRAPIGSRPPFGVTRTGETPPERPGTIDQTGAVSSVGRAPARQAGGHWFEPSTAHLRNPLQIAGFFVKEPSSRSTERGVWQQTG